MPGALDIRFPSLEAILGWSAAATGAAIHAAIAITLALALHFAVFRMLNRLARLSQTTSDDIIFAAVRQPMRWLMAAIAVSIAAESDLALARIWAAAARFVVPALLGWTAFSLVKAGAKVLESHANLSTDELAARSRRTRISILSRASGFVIVFITLALMLLGIPGVRNIGVTLMASAGLAGLAVGAAAQPALKSLIAGIQMALTEPIRLGDLVVIDGETGRVEDIRMTYVVIRTIDERRLIVPTVKFLDSTFQNWTRVRGGLTGHVLLPISPDFPVAPVRAEFLRQLAAHPGWDGRTGELFISEIRVDHVELKLMMSARDPASLAALRPAMREGMIDWMREAAPDAVCRPPLAGQPPAANRP